MDLLLLELHHPGTSPVLAGFFLIDTQNEKLQLRIRREWPEILDSVDREYLESLGPSLANLKEEMGVSGLLTFLDETLSNTLRLSVRLQIHHDGATILALADRLADCLLISPTPRSD